MESLKNPRPEEFLEPEYVEMVLKEPKDLPTEQIINILKGKEPSYFFDHRDLKEVLLRRNVTFSTTEPFSWPLQPILVYLIVLCIFAFFGWTLFKSLKDKERKKEEKKKLKQKKKK